MKVLAYSILFLAGFVFNGWSYTANNQTLQISSDGSYADTAAAVAYVQSQSQDGWVLTVGASGGQYAWNSPLVINIPQLFTMRGADTNNRPTITVSCPSSPGIVINCVSNKTVVIRDFIFNEWNTANCLFDILGNGPDCFRLSDLKFNHSAGVPACAWIGDTYYSPTTQGCYGLIDHCEINSSGGSGYGFYIRDEFSSWLRPMSMGTRQAVYVEDCIFHAVTCDTGSPAIDGDNGARFMVRYCSLTNFGLATHGAEILPTNSVLQWEIAHNTWTMSTGQGLAFGFFARGGTGVMFSNTFTAQGNGFYNCALCMEYYRALANNGVCPQDRFYPADYVGTQQPGCGVMIGTNADPHFPSMPWASVPVYYWGNAINATMTFPQAGASAAGFVQQNTNFFINVASPGYTEYTYPHPLNLVGAPGISSGGGSGTGSGNGTVFPPTNLQAHPPSN